MALVSKPIRAVFEKGPNHIFHLMAVARNGFYSDYAGRYEGLFPPGGLTG